MMAVIAGLILLAMLIIGFVLISYAFLNSN